MHAVPFLAVLLLSASGTRAEIRVGAGGDSNAFEFPEDSAASNASPAQPGMFVPVDARVRLKTSPRRPVRLGAEASLDGMFFAFVRQDPAAAQSTRPSDLNRFTAEASLPVVFDPAPERRRGFRVDFTFEPFAAMHRETYTSHRTGQPFESGGVSLADRYSTNSFGAKVDGDVSIGRNVDLIVGGRVTRADHVEDYEDVPEIDSWDHSEYRGDVDAHFTSEGWLAAAGYTLRQRDYDERFPRDDTGAKVPDTDPRYRAQSFTAHELSVRGGVVRERGRAVLRAGTVRRVDGFVGYENYTEQWVGADLRIAVGESELRLAPKFMSRTYDELRVDYDPTEPVSDRTRLSIDASYEWPMLTARTRGFVSAGYVAQQSANPLFTYAAFRGVTGVVVSWR